MSENEPTREQEKIVANAWLFDVDGVLSHLEQKKVTEAELFEQLLKRLEAGEPIIFNTGRDVGFVIKNILEPLSKILPDQNLLKNILTVGEKGAVSALYDEKLDLKEYVDQTVTIPKDLQNEIKGIVDEEFSEYMFFDVSKKTMISIEALPGCDLKQFGIQQKILNQRIAQLLDKYQLSDKYKIQPDQIATNVECVRVGKDLGVQRMYWWLQHGHIKPKKFIAFGDSLSDLAMAAELDKRHLPVEMVFVGDPKVLAGKEYKFSVTCANDLYEKGTLDYLKNH